MKYSFRERLAIGATGCAAVLAAGAGLYLWFAATPPLAFTTREPEPDRGADAKAAVVAIEGEWEVFSDAPVEPSGSWPRFRGPRSDNVARESAPLAATWPPEGPPELWSVALGDGYAAAAVHNGRVYVLDYDEDRKADALRCFRLSDGQELWQRRYEIAIKRNHGISRAIPAVSDRFVVSMGPRCHVLCADAETGAFRWGIDLARNYGTEVPLWYSGQCPLIDDDVAVLAPAGRVLMLGVSCETGETVWETPNPDGWKLSHASIIPVVLHGTRQYIYCALGGIVSVSAEPEARGRVLWKTTEWDHAVVAPSAVALPDNRVLVTAGYGVGSRLFRIERDGESWQAEVEQTWPRTHFACEQQTPVYYNERLYTVMPNDAGALNRQVVCMRPDGTHVWASGREYRFGLGPFMIADGKLLVLDDRGTLVLADAAADRFRVLAEAKVLEGREAWGPLALVDGLLLCRDAGRMVCLDLGVR